MYVYITGRGHSGSTVLDAMLGNSSAVESVGELVSGMGRPQAWCSCGQRMNECDYWTEVRSRFESKSGHKWQQFVLDTQDYAHVIRFFPTLITNTKSLREFSDTTAHFTDSILEFTGKKALLDSSKTPSRALFLAKFFPESRVIHLVRHPDGILASNYWRIKNGTGFRFLRKNFRGKFLAPVYLIVSAFAWLIGNLLAEIIKLSNPSKVMLIKYEDMGQDSDGVFKKISEFLGVDLNEIAIAIRNKESLSFGHNIGGNGVRYKKAFVFDASQGSKRSLPVVYKIIIRIICWPLMLRYNYKIFSL